MSKAIAFFPWVYINEQQEIGPIKFLPYQRNKLPGNLTHTNQNEIDEVFAAYADLTNKAINRAIILEFDDWHTGMDIPNENIDYLFQVKELIAFSALSKRNFFQQPNDYCNYDTYTLIIQKFSPDKIKTFSYTTRRRDGNTKHLWSSTNRFAFYQPEHVVGITDIKIDSNLLSVLLSLPEDKKDRYYESIKEFNAANTDSRTIPEHVEIVMCKSAFECLLDIDEKMDEFVKTIKVLLKDIDGCSCEGPLKAAWAKRWGNKQPIYAWANEFCVIRGNSAHGKCRTNSKLVWQVDRHLLFAAVFFPLMLKKTLYDNKLFSMNHYDFEKLKLIDKYILNDPFGSDSDDNVRSSWNKIDQEANINTYSLLISLLENTIHGSLPKNSEEGN
ncbi:MAG: hypothetical protein KGI54_12595 [Pseudomonadota bacterium]|nr:hypothetical protein [Pseudomonadota bacterium]